MQNVLAVVVVLLLLGGGFYWYMQSSNEALNTPPVNLNTGTNTGADTGNTDTGTANPAINTGTNIGIDGSVSTGVTKEVTINNAGMTFATKALSVKKGERVKITFKNTGGTHDFRIDGYNVGTKVIQAGQQESFEFVADKAGTFEYYCSVGNHRAMGMKGTLTVTN